MISPFKLASQDKNYFKIGTNKKLAFHLREFFQKHKDTDLWDLHTERQTMAEALQHTKMIPLRHPIADQQVNTTLGYNQILKIEDTRLKEHIFIFKKLIEWIENEMLKTGAKSVEYGRIFFSNHLAKTKIGLHVDEGAYFDYYDRFHFVIDQVDGSNVFYIRNDPMLLLTGSLYWVNNHVPHWLENESDSDRINLIFDARLT